MSVHRHATGGQYLDRVTANHPVGIAGGKICGFKKKSADKSLIPLPPTGSASVFNASPGVVTTILQPMPAVGLGRR